MRHSTPRLIIIGCGEAFDSGLGNNSCLLTGPKTVLFDCGYQIPERLWALKQSSQGVSHDLDAIALTHLHADHAFGLAPLLMRMWEERRTRKLTLLGPRGTRTYWQRLMDLAYPSMRSRFLFEVSVQELTPDQITEWGGLRFETARSTHSILNLAIRVEGPRGVSFAVSGDGAMTDATRALFAGVKVLLHEVYTVRPTLETHGDLKTLSQFVTGSAIGRVAITHVCRSEKAAMKRAFMKLRQRDSRWTLLKPGMEISF